MDRYIKKAFTLAEVMIVFAVIGVLTAILVPTLFQASPDQNLLKAKKSFNTLTRAIETLTNSSPYDTNGGLLESAPFAQNANARLRLFCNNLAQVLNVKDVDCAATDSIATGIATIAEGDRCTGSTNLCLKTTTLNSNTVFDYAKLQGQFDTVCNYHYANSGNFNFKTSDGVKWAIQQSNFNEASTVTVDGVAAPAFYNVICFDVGNHTSNAYMFGAGVRKDGKIVVGSKLQAALEKDKIDDAIDIN